MTQPQPLMQLQPVGWASFRTAGRLPVGSVDESADTEPVNGRDLDAATIAIVSDRARQARLL
jgi:hypothetical protein